MKYFVWLSRPGRKACILQGLENVISLLSIKKGEPAAFKNFPSNACFKMDPEYPKRKALEDQLSNLDRMVTVSAEFRTFLQQQTLSNTEFLNVSIFNHANELESDNYSIVHPVKVVDCIDISASKIQWNHISPGLISSCGSLVLNNKAFGSEDKIIRPKYLEMFLLVREDLAANIKKQKFTGVDLKLSKDFAY